MVKIAICDNDKRDLQLMEMMVQEYLSAHPDADCCTVSFDSSGALKNSLKSESDFRIFILDIIMPVTDGIQIGRFIREIDENAAIIYTTTAEEYALKAFQNHAIRYLLKPVRRNELFSALDFALALISSTQARLYTVKCKDGIVSLNSSSIVLVESRNRAAVYAMRDGSSVRSVSIRGTFEDAVSPLPEDPDFVRPHKSFYVNMNFIHEIRPGSLLLDNGREIPVSRRYAAQVNSEYLQFLARKEGIRS